MTLVAGDAAIDGSSAVEESPDGKNRRGWYTVFVLAVVVMLAHIDRGVIALFVELARERFPGRFPGVHTFFHTHSDLASEVRCIAAHPAMVAGRALVGDFVNARMRPEFLACDYEVI